MIERGKKKTHENEAKTKKRSVEKPTLFLLILEN